MLDFFMGANTPNGFYSFYDELKVPKIYTRSYLIKGGAGTGKSGIMKRVAVAFKRYEPLLEQIHCSSDPNSLDGVILHKAKVSLVDATPPHVIEPSFPGGFETVINLCEYINEPKAEKRLEKTVLLQTENSACHKKCQKLMRAASILLDDNACFVESLTDFAKIKESAKRICKAVIPIKKAKGEEYKRLLSAVTSDGITLYESTINQLCDTVIAINDNFSVSAKAFMTEVSGYVKASGYTAFYCYCPLDPIRKIEHIIIPELKLAFITKSPFHKFANISVTKNIHFTRFTDMIQLQRKKQGLNFNKRLAVELLSSASDTLKEAKKIHDKLEQQYIDTVDFAMVDKKTDEILEKIRARYKFI